ncbi:two-component system response regulator ResD [Breznakia sp. PF5-3]|uniref:response regulator transcription factor n=1 Tax=unclassified Breznakia TaxID=2623764 RepID=UPI002405D9B7|nr:MULTISPECIES: response regulator transcription factor [unclassified Breznakia]MDL2276082.1 response regulator transcription factor [Breznakia sp. OttesenSCG-928-G09]MDF9825088.1 two-component system response regulator ResD [Breznakia sp. PM6-1]MDF9835935.1 two-component system response regulator ResD [Breznakia sp. PF5-3]MDF9837463.1 two-component system response regulator ResD [Breznakia sp. PFB2-8]MDF9859474.1 two-component system response regulator ResD [Breznakia sp. PH5-24]
MKRLLIVDDEANIREIIKKYAKFEGYEYCEAKDGLEAIDVMKKNEHIDLVIMDAMMPELDGFSACKEIRKFSNVPILMLSARGEEYDRIHGFEIGVDDYVVKPFSPKELMMRIAAIMNRYQNSNNVDKFIYKTFEVNFTSRVVKIDNERVELSPKEYDLLFYLINNKDIALTREQLISKVWGYDFYGDDRTLDTHIKLLRKKLQQYSTTIVTLRGVGYRFETKEDEAED